jgi:hypothetical protein
MVLYQKTIEIPEGIQPSNLITLNEDYQEKLRDFKQYISTRVNSRHIAYFSTQRITQHGPTIVDKKMFVTLIQPNGFYATQNYKDETDTPVFFRYDNVLGEIPCLQIDKNTNFFEISNDFPEISKQLLELYEDLKHHNTGGIELEYQYAPRTTFEGKKFSILGNLIQVNKSNIEYQHVRTWGGELIQLNKTDKTYSLVDLVPHREIDRFIAPDRILREIRLHDVCFQINTGDQRHFYDYGTENEKTYTLEELLEMSTE